MKKDVFTIDVFNVNFETDITPVCLLIPFYDLDKAINKAKLQAELLSDADDVIEVRVMAGEYENEKGEIWGEPEVVFTASNSTKEQTMNARKEQGYCSLEVDYYARILINI